MLSCMARIYYRARPYWSIVWLYLTKAACEAAMGAITDGQICAGGALNKDACQGDSGGPLTYESNGQHVLIGDVSYGDGCGKEGKYGVYGRVSFYRTWIEGKMTSPKFCGNTANAANAANAP